MYNSLVALSKAVRYYDADYPFGTSVPYNIFYF